MATFGLAWAEDEGSCLRVFPVSPPDSSMYVQNQCLLWCQNTYIHTVVATKDEAAAGRLKLVWGVGVGEAQGKPFVPFVMFCCTRNAAAVRPVRTLVVSLMFISIIPVSYWLVGLKKFGADP
jgi:hypothetical protein